MSSSNMSRSSVDVPIGKKLHFDKCWSILILRSSGDIVGCRAVNFPTRQQINLSLSIILLPRQGLCLLIFSLIEPLEHSLVYHLGAVQLLGNWQMFLQRSCQFVNLASLP